MHYSYPILVAARPLIITPRAMTANSLSCLGLPLFSKSEVRLSLPTFCHICYGILQMSAIMSDEEQPNWMQKSTCPQQKDTWASS